MARRRRIPLIFRMDLVLASPFEGPEPLSCRVIVDTGTTTGLILPPTLAEQLGLTLVAAETLPTDITGQPIPGYGSTALMITDDGEYETIVFIPEQGAPEAVLGCFALGQLGTEMTVGSVHHRFPRQNPSRLDPTDFSGHILTSFSAGVPYPHDDEE